MAAAIRALLVERRYPFLITLTLFLLSVFLLFSNTSNPSDYLPFLKDLNLSQSSRSSFPISFSAPDPDPDPDPSGDLISSGDGEIQDDRRGEAEAVEEFEAKWGICRGGSGYQAADYIPCLDNWNAIKKLKSRRHMEHRERHCPKPSPRCLVPLPPKYRAPVPWPKSRDMIWYENVPHPKLVEYKKDQNWVQKSGDYLVFPGGGTQFKDGVANYIQFIEQVLPAINWGRHTRVILDVGCGVGSFGGYLLEKDVITMSFAPKDEHEAQIQFALERGIPAFLSVIGTQRLPFPDNVFDSIHCARCRVHWHGDGGKPLLELNRILRPGGFFVWSATPVYRDNERDQTVWNAMVKLTSSICWKTVVKSTDASGIGIVIYQKPFSNSCYNQRKKNIPPLCNKKNRPGISWYVPLDSCLAEIPLVNSEHEHQWPASWPERLNYVSLSLPDEPTRGGIEAIFYNDTKYWEKLISEVYLRDLGINWQSVRNVLDMSAGFGGFAAALAREPLWVMNAVPSHGPDTLPIIFDRGIIGMYHDWCEAFNTYPRTYDLLHSYFLFENLTKRCDIVVVVVEMDRVLRPGGWVLIQDTSEMLKKVCSLLQSLHWITTLYKQKILVGKKGFWRPDS